MIGGLVSWEGLTVAREPGDAQVPVSQLEFPGFLWWSPCLSRCFIYLIPVSHQHLPSPTGDVSLLFALTFFATIIPHPLPPKKCSGDILLLPFGVRCHIYENLVYTKIRKKKKKQLT